MIPYEVIFLVDDDPINNLINKRLLVKLGIKALILEFQEGIEAISLLEKSDPKKSTLIFLDINMPIMNGWEFLSVYQEKFPHRNDEIIILSSSIDYQDRLKAQDYKVVSGYLEKPLTMDKITSQLIR
jgi:CheY-like chemotaxis protein